METSYIRSLKRLRALREGAGLTLKQLEIKSRGRWKAVVVGSYERGTRHLSLKRAVELCDFYGADLSDLGAAPAELSHEKVVLDLKRLSEARNLPDEITSVATKIAAKISSLRNDKNGEVLSIRGADIEYLQLVTDLQKAELFRALKLRQLLIKQLER